MNGRPGRQLRQRDKEPLAVCSTQKINIKMIEVDQTKFDSLMSDAEPAARPLPADARILFANWIEIKRLQGVRDKTKTRSAAGFGRRSHLFDVRRGEE